MAAICRRAFLGASAALVPGATGGILFGQATSGAAAFLDLPAKPVTKGPNHHFYGYYDKTPWDETGRYLLACQIGFAGRQPDPSDELTVGMVDLKHGDKYIPLARTAAWCWQQGAMLQWLGSAPQREVIFNSVDEGRLTATILDVHTGRKRTLPRPIYALSADGRQAVTLDFARLHRLRPGYGYACCAERFADHPAPAELGVWWMDVATGDNKLVITLEQLAAFKPDERFVGAHHWVNHLQFNPSGTRFVLLHRWKKPGAGSWQTRMLTARPDGADLRITLDEGLISHFDWRDDRTILAWARTKQHGDHFYAVDVLTGQKQIVGAGVLIQDGHCSYSPDRKWILTDTYPDQQRMQTLMLFEAASARLYKLNKFHSPKQYTGPWRCDLHPRWDRQGAQVCFDGCHDAQRQVYVMDVSAVVRAS